MARILLMEDDQDQAELLAMILIREGHDVTVTADAAAAIDRVGQERFDLVVSDLFVRQKGVLVSNGGLRLIGYIRNGARKGEQATAFDVPVIALSGVMGGPTDSHFLKIAESVGANRRLEKPVSPSYLNDVINELLAP
ncbi:response regulator [Pseudooceanicola sediminis]|uniref:Response regulator n=1 Tax=Pseudooceanicola sediminis TaxID=2211117 RepID=A0A399JB48_9RHOB|nr:response regulator [Pseudooceanicola sediminis]KAA2314278.1 response regulator [Puniceibacterium sp. HSS470]RII39866.1 response regulator [Pseudooceanicola sediminis]|tara:strand:+ start:107 stop:520 length:414 start_codon:yes stop_codon:yes gene_type:complete